MPEQQRVAYFNDRIVPEDQVLISFRDRGFVLGDAVFDATRTFAGKAFRLHEHVDRLYRSLKAIGIKLDINASEMVAISEDVLERNRTLLAEGEDYWIIQRVSRGVNIVGGELWQSSGPTVIVECTPLPFKARAPLFRDGIDIFIPSVRRVPPESLSPNIKSHNYLNLVLADQEVRDRSPNAWAILLDNRGFMTEGIGSNVFLVKEGKLYTPKSQYVLAGISRQTVIELAAELEIEVIEDDLSPYDLVTADEAFVTSTSFCLCPVRSCGGSRIGDGSIPGPVTKALSQSFSRLVNYDFVDQYLRCLN